MFLFRRLFVSALGLAAATAVQAQTPRVPSLPTLQQLGIHKTQAHKLAARTNATVYVPTESVSYDWDDEAGKWNDTEAQKTVTSFNAQLLPTQVVVSDSSTNEPQERQILGYDAQARLTQLTAESWENGAWEKVGRTIIGYDAQGEMTSVESEAWAGSGWLFVLELRYNITRNSAGLIEQKETEIRTAMDPAFSKTERETYTITNGRYSEILIQSWDRSTNAYVNDTRQRNIVWADWNNRLMASFEGQKWDAANSAWAQDTRHSFSYGATAHVETIEIKDGVNWVNENRLTSLFDGQNRGVGSREELWTGSAWETTAESRVLVTYGADNRVLREVTQELDLLSNSFVNLTRVNNRSFQSSVINSARNRELAAKATLYPNPVANQATLDLAGLRSAAPVTAEVISSTGRVVRAFQLQPKQGALHETVDLSTLPGGVYSLRLNTGEGTTVTRFVRQ